MTTEIDAEGLAKAVDAGWKSYSGSTDYEHIEGVVTSAIRAYLSASRSTSEAEPVAWRFPHQLWPDQWQFTSGDPGEVAGKEPLGRITLPTPASDDQVEALNLAAAALAPFASAVFNDNGDLTIDASAPTSKDLAAAYFALRKVRAALLAAMGSTKP